jgi:hypothetical protein
MYLMPISKTATNSTNHDSRYSVMNCRARSISLAAVNVSLKGGSLNGVVCAHVRQHADAPIPKES